MWILESHADFLQGKRMWLKPGQKYIFGRVRNQGVRFAIDHKTISRRHFVITVDAVKPGDVSRLHARSQILVKDLKSKHGTFIDGDVLQDDERQLKNAEHRIRPGSLQQDLVLKWQPCVLTFSLSAKEIQAGALKGKQDRLQDLDIKVVSEYVTGSTTHVISTKRNTPKGLQALIQAGYIVSESYIDALIYASTSADLGEEENLSPLEQDFDSSWPSEAAHLPPQGKEPTARPAEAYAPNQERSKVFEDFIFVFGDPKQYNNLLPPITLGQGKALLYQIVYGETTVDELVQYLRNTAGQKGFGDGDRETDKGGVVLVRWNGAETHSGWTENLVNQVALKLDQRAIDQAEFLDAILANDAFVLRNTIPYESNIEGRVAPPASLVSQAVKLPIPLPTTPATRQPVPQVKSVVPSKRHAQAPERNEAAETEDRNLQQPHVNGQSSNTEPGDPPPKKRSRLLGAPIAKITGIDDDFDIDSVANYDPPSQSLPPESQANEGSRAVSEAPSIKDEPSSTRKHTLDTDLDGRLPNAEASKRRKLFFEQQIHTSQKSPAPSAARPRYPKREKTPELDILEAVREKREKEEAEEKAKHQDDVDEDMDFDPERDKDLVKVRTFEVKPRGGAQLVSNGNATSSHTRTVVIGGYRTNAWDDKWNGRKNFKSFVKAWPKSSPYYEGNADGDGAVQPLRRRKVIVPLVRWKPPRFGLGDEYWDGDGKRIERKKNKGSQSQTQPSASSTHARAGEEGDTIHDSDEDSVDYDDNDSDQPNDDIDQTDPTNPRGPSASQPSPSTNYTSPPHPSPELARLQAEAGDFLDHDGDADSVIDIDSPRRTRASDHTTSSQKRSTQKQAQVPRSQARTTTQNKSQSAKSKPSSSTAASKASGKAKSKAPPKQTRIPVVQVLSSDVEGSQTEDDDDMKFKFGKRARELSKRNREREKETRSAGTE